MPNVKLRIFYIFFLLIAVTTSAFAEPPEPTATNNTAELRALIEEKEAQLKISEESFSNLIQFSETLKEQLNTVLENQKQKDEILIPRIVVSSITLILTRIAHINITASSRTVNNTLNRLIRVALWGGSISSFGVLGYSSGVLYQSRKETEELVVAITIAIEQLTIAKEQLEDDSLELDMLKYKLRTTKREL